MAEHLKTVASNLSSSSSLQNYRQTTPAHVQTAESPKSQQLGVESQKAIAVPRIKKLDIAKRQSENVTPTPKRAERGEVGHAAHSQQ